MARAPYGDDEPWLAEGVREERSTLVPRARLFSGGLIALALAVLVALGVYLAAGRKSDGATGYVNPADAPVIDADAGPYKVAPTDPGGAKITGIDDTVAGVASGVDQASMVAPDEPEEPLARPVAGTPVTLPPTDLLPATPPAATLPTRPVAAAPVVAPPAAKPATQPARVAHAEPDPLAPSPPRSTSKLARSDTETPTAPSAKPSRAAPDPLAPPAEPDAARAARFDPAAAGNDGATVKTGTKAAGGAVVLQLGAFSTRDKADAAWAKAGNGGALAGLTKRVEPIERNGATLYRLRAAGVASKSAATALCGRIAAAGGACIVAD